jgi:hypothetical protein
VSLLERLVAARVAGQAKGGRRLYEKILLGRPVREMANPASFLL